MDNSHEPPLEFVRLAPEHLDDVMNIEIEAYPHPWTRTMFTDEIRNARSRFFVAMLGGVLVGYAGFWLVLDECHITKVTVRRDVRRRGLGRRILRHLLDTSAQLGARIATLEVRESNTPARRLYPALGFTQVGVRKGYYAQTNEDAIVMLKELT